MNKYKKIILLLQLLSILIILGTILFIFLPIYQNLSKPGLNLEVSFLMKNSGKYEWFINQEKIQENNLGHEQLIFADEQILNQQILESIYHKSIVLESLFDRINEDNNKIQQLSLLIGINYTGYSGKTYQDLSSKDEISQNFIDQYEKQSGKKWTFYGEGIVISSLENIIVLQKGLDYKGTLMLTSNSSKKMPFMGNFEITSGSLDTKADANFKLNLTNKGKELFDNYSLENIFPAYYIMNSPLYNLYYFAGDFSEYEPDLPAIHELSPTIMKNKILYNKGNNEQVYWQWYYPKLIDIIGEVKGDGSMIASETQSISKFHVQNKKIYMKNSNTESEQFFIKGINLGAALPGKEFTEFPQNKGIYLDWFEKMQGMNVNTVRIYTLFPPVFYEALCEFNRSSTKPLYLFQEIWPEEKPTNSNYLDLDYNKTYQEEIKNVVDSIHGNGNIPERQYRAYGLYRFDVSEYLLGYLVGREMEPEEVLETDILNDGYSFKGEYIYSEEDASPTESWLAASCDYALEIESKYNSQPMVGIVSWPTLDPLTHDSEWNLAGDKSLQYNDKAVVDIDHIEVNSYKVTGFFGAYHIYPNYPDFINNDASYGNYRDDLGQFRYGGYLQDFMEQNSKYPAIVAEYGISISMYTAHFNPDGYDHGGLSEEDQADGIIRMTKAIITEGYAGAIIFEWMDEWAKKTWTTEPYMSPYSRNPYWHNAMDPEQNYGLIGYKSNQNILDELTLIYGGNQNNIDDDIENVSAGQDASYLYLDVKLKKVVSKEHSFTIAISTDSEKSEENYSEFIINYNENPKILVNPGYNWIKGHYLAQNYDVSMYEELIQLTNNENMDRNGVFTPSKSQNLSNLLVGSFEIPQNQIQIENNHIVFRLPYGLLGISDPSSMYILSDDNEIIPTSQDMITIKKNSKINYEIIFGEKKYLFEQNLTPWTDPIVTSIQKKGLNKIGEFFGKID